jgi:tetratricopeptide (TPR) repeat protein
MQSLEPPDSIHLRSAQGWVEVGNPTEAAADLARVSPGLCEHPEVLEVRWQLAVQAKRWPEGLAVAECLCRLAPESPFGWIHRSYCLHELKRTREAWDALLPIAERFPKEWLICYNLACYASRLGQLDEAQAWFQRALDRGDPRAINRLASHDPDLIPMRERRPGA